jgi:hypothetical protein
MCHDRITTTEQYMAYRPQPELASQITRVLDPHSLPENVTPIRPASAGSFLERLEEEIPAKWLREVQRIYAETDTGVDVAPGLALQPGGQVLDLRHGG